MATRKKAATARKPKSTLEVVKAAVTMIKFTRYGRTQVLVIRPYDDGNDSGGGDMTIVAPCGDDMSLPKDVAVAAANAVLELAKSL